MIFALDQEENVLYTFSTEQRAATFCQQAGGHRTWRLWDDTGRALIPIGFAPAAPLGLFALQGLMDQVHAKVLQAEHPVPQDSYSEHAGDAGWWATGWNQHI